MEYDTGFDDGDTIDRSYEQVLEARRLAAEASQKALDALPAGREKDMVIAMDELLSFNLGDEEGYLGRVGLTRTNQIRRALASYGITPDYGAAIGHGLRLERKRR